MRSWWRVIEIFSKWLGQASLKAISDDFWKRRVSPVEYLKRELSDRRESQFQGARVRVCLGKSSDGRKTSPAREQWMRGGGEKMEVERSPGATQTRQGLVHFF